MVFPSYCSITSEIRQKNLGFLAQGKTALNKLTRENNTAHKTWIGNVHIEMSEPSLNLK